MQDSFTEKQIDYNLLESNGNWPNYNIMLKNIYQKPEVSYKKLLTIL